MGTQVCVCVCVCVCVRSVIVTMQNQQHHPNPTVQHRDHLNGFDEVDEWCGEQEAVRFMCQGLVILVNLSENCVVRPFCAVTGPEQLSPKRLASRVARLC